MTLAVYEQIRSAIGAMPAETGGMLGGSFDAHEITNFFFDQRASRSSATYSPDTATVNEVLDTEWNPAGVRLLGFVHSHPPGIIRPSHGDQVYAERILTHNRELPYLLLPIAQSGADSEQFQIRMFVATRSDRGVNVARIPVIISAQDDEQSGYTNQPASRCTPYPLENSSPNIKPTPATRGRNRIAEESSAPHRATFARVESAYDLEHLQVCRVIYIGVGGAAAYAEDLTRAGVSEHVIIDPDVVSETNIATQQVYRKDIGRPKAACVAERLVDINPNAGVIARQQALNAISDAAFRELAFVQLPNRPPPREVLLCGLTDNFEAQARVNRLGLNFGLPTLCAQVYKEGRAAEVTFTYPGVTPACHRCILSARYDAYIKNGFKNDVTSHGTPIFATTRLNSIKGFVAMAILHHGGNHPRWGAMLARIGNRNLVQVRLDPDVASTLGLSNFQQAFNGTTGEQLFFDETIWRAQLPESPATGYAAPCPDCGGTGNLRYAIGSFPDTRLMRQSMD